MKNENVVEKLRRIFREKEKKLRDLIHKRKKET